MEEHPVSEESKDIENNNHSRDKRKIIDRLFVIISFPLIVAFIVFVMIYSLSDFDGQVFDTACNKIESRESMLNHYLEAEEKREEKISHFTETLSEAVEAYGQKVHGIDPDDHRDADDLSDRVKRHVFDHSCHAYWDKVASK